MKPRMMAMRMVGSLFLGMMLASFGGTPVWAAPATALSITSDRLEMDDKSQVAVFMGHVVADNGRMRLSANRMTVFYDKKRKPGAASGGVREVKAEGQVIIQEDKNKGKADAVNYQIEKRTLELLGKESDASIQHGEDVLTGRRILVTLDNEQRIGKVMVQGAENHRVSARITPSGLLQRGEASAPAPAKPPVTQKPSHAPGAQELENPPKDPQQFSVPSPDVWNKEAVKSPPDPAAVAKEGPEAKEGAVAKPEEAGEANPREGVTGLKETVAGWKETVAGWKENAPGAPGDGVEASAFSKVSAPLPAPRRRSTVAAQPKR